MKAATFTFDVTPPIGHPLCGGWITPAKKIVDPLFARGLILRPDDETGSGDDEPVVLCAVDWCWIRGESHDRWRAALALAVGTSPERVAVQCVHQHDALMADLEADRILAREGLDVRTLQTDFFEDVLRRASAAAGEAGRRLRRVSHIGTGEGLVSQVASNRRVLGPDRKVRYWRGSSCKDAEARAQPEGTIDPRLKCITLHDGNHKIAALYYYATHPMSYYGRGGVSADFVGMARRAMDEAAPETTHIYFTGCAGDVAAGKYNDGSPENRPILAERMRLGMKAAFDSAGRAPEPVERFDWRVEAVRVPMRAAYDRAYFEGLLRAKNGTPQIHCKGAMGLASWDRYEAGRKIVLSCLRINHVSVLHLPGEPLIAYQFAAQEIGRAAGRCEKGFSHQQRRESSSWAKDSLREASPVEISEGGQDARPPGAIPEGGQDAHPPDAARVPVDARPPREAFVAVAGYGDAGPAYMPTAVNYGQGGYEVGMAWCGPGVEAVLKKHMQRLLQA